jgi:dipeptidyl aminopeptidase/acylaminoacyl peptidase
MLPLMAIALLLALGLVAGVIAISYILAWRITRPGVHTYWDEYTFVPADMGVPYETVRFTSPDGLALAGWLMRRPHRDGQRLP